MKTLTFILLMFVYLNVFGQYTFTYTEIKESVLNVDVFIEKLIEDKEFRVIEKDGDDYMIFAKNYNKDKESASIWVEIEKKIDIYETVLRLMYRRIDYMIDSTTGDTIWTNPTPKKKKGDLFKSTKIRVMIQFSDNANYKYLVGKIKQYCKKLKFEYDDNAQAYINYYEHSDGIQFVFHKSGDLESLSNYIIIYNY
ncbi:hypothetical protein ES705_11903 [subsurface metagenome]